MPKTIFLSSKSGAAPRFIFAGEVDAMHPTCSNRNERDTGTPGHLVVDHNQCLAGTTFGHRSLEHHAGPAVPLSKHSTWQRLQSVKFHWEMCVTFKLCIAERV